MSHVQSLSKMMPAGALPIGLGCSRLGSVNGADGPEARALLDLALERGFRFFDTSNIYGQGDSEKLIAAALAGRDDCLVCSKAGKYVTWKRRVLLPVKGLLRGVVRRSTQAKDSVYAARSKPMPTCWDAPFLTASLEGSLRRLKRDRIDLFMLHSPSAEVMEAGEAVEALERARSAGKIGLIGVSVDDPACADAALADPRVEALQVPLLPGATDYDELLLRARARGVSIIAREILGGAQAIAGAVDPAAYAAARIATTISDSRISLPIVGTTRVSHLNAAATAASRV